MKAKIAIVYDRLNVAHGGAEQVLLALHKLYPQAVLFSSIYDPREAAWAKSFQVQTSFLQKLPLATKLHRYLAIFMPLAFEFLDLSSYDIIISVTSAEAKGVITRRDQLHLCYLLSPPRYLYHYQAEYLRKNRFLNLFFVRPLVKFALNYLKKWDQQAIFRPDRVIPIAQAVNNRAQKYYEKLELGPVIYPPIDNTLLAEATSGDVKQQDYLLLVARLVPYKNVDAAILACQKTGQRLVIVGEGPEEERLKKLVRTKLITFKKKQSRVELANLYRNCQAVLSLGLDDFSITALEANLFAKPVIINQLAGAAELIKHRQHGLHLPFMEGDRAQKISQNLVDSLKILAKTEFDPQQLRKNALKYDTNRFALHFDAALRQAYQAKTEGKL
jgi:glycosyltransferase involved in cell wall biosynthesis